MFGVEVGIGADFLISKKMPVQQLLNTLPEEVLELILRRLDKPDDLINCSRAHPRLDEELKKRKCLYLFPQVLPHILRKLDLKDVLQIPDVCPEWRDTATLLDQDIPGRQPYNEDLYRFQMDTTQKDASEDKLLNNVWFLSFNNIGRDMRSFETAIKNTPDKIPFGVGRSASFVINNNEWQIQQIYLQKLLIFLRKFGKHFWYVKLTLTGTYSLEMNQLENCTFIRLLLAALPNVRSFEINVDIDDHGKTDRTMSDRVPITQLTNLESLSLSLGQRSAKHREKFIVLRYALQLKKLRLTAWPGNLPKVMPCLVDLHLQVVQSMDVFDNLRSLQAPVQKLTLDFEDCFCNGKMNIKIIFAKISNLPLRQLVLRWRYLQRHLSERHSYKPMDLQFLEIQFPNLHTFTICNYPEEWHPLLLSFPRLRYFNIRDNVLSYKGNYEYNSFWRKEELLIRRILYGQTEKFVRFPKNLNPERFPVLQQVSVETREGFEQPECVGRLLYNGKWTSRNLNRES